MAGDWIKMRTGLADDPAVVAIACATRLDSDSVVGKLHRIWSWADHNTRDGLLRGITAAWIDSYVKKRGFAAALAALDPPWLLIESIGITIPHFERHNGDCAKSRALATRRQHMSRSKRDNSVTVSLQKRDQRREEKSLIAPAQAAVDWLSRRKDAEAIAKRLGRCGDSRNKRLVLGACVLQASGPLPENWLQNAVEETADARAHNPYAFLRTVLIRTAEAEGVDFRTSLRKIVFPKVPPTPQ